MSEKKSIDDFLLFGRYGLLLAILIEFVMIVECGNLLFMTFAGADAEIISCHSDSPETNVTYSSDDYCAMFNQDDCPDSKFHYDFRSVNVEWKLLCDKKERVKDSTSYQMIGALLGSVIWGRASDRFGRRPAMLVTLIFTGLFGIASAFANSLLTFTILRTFGSFFVVGTGIVANTFFGEFFPSRYRQGLSFILNWSPNLLVVTGIAYVSHSWRAFAIIISVATIPASLIMAFLDETPHFLLRNGKPNESMKVLERIHNINRHEVDVKALGEVFREKKQQLEDTEATKSKTEAYSIFHLFCTPQLIAYTVALCLSNFQTGFISFSLLFNLEKVSGSLYQNLIIVGVFRYGFNLVSALAEYRFKWLGRKISHHIFCVITMIFLFASMIGDLTNAPSLFSRIFLLTTAAIVVQLFAVLGIICNEIFPTALRNTSYAFTQFVQSIAPILAPHLYSVSGSHKWLPPVIMLAWVFADIIVFAFAIPESRGKPLVDKMPDNEKRFRIFQDRRDTVSVKKLDP